MKKNSDIWLKVGVNADQYLEASDFCEQHGFNMSSLGRVAILKMIRPNLEEVILKPHVNSTSQVHQKRSPEKSQKVAMQSHRVHEHRRLKMLR
jgi:hypothetical protein